jgi:hypothetical protein
MSWVKPQCTKLKKSTLVDNPEMFFRVSRFPKPHLHIGYKLYIVFLFGIHSTVNKVVDNFWLLGLIHTVIICVDCGLHAAHNILPETDPRLFEVQIYSKNHIDQSTRSTATEGPWPLHFEYSHWWKRWRRSTFASYYAWGIDGVGECKINVKVYMDSYMASNGSCFMTTWTISKNRMLELGSTQNHRETVTLRNPHNRWFVLFCDVWKPHMKR